MEMFVILIPNDLLLEAGINQTNDVFAFSFKIVAARLISDAYSAALFCYGSRDNKHI